MILRMILRRAYKMVTRDRESGWTFTLLVCIPYVAFLIWMHMHHEMWRDEIHAWTLSRLVHSFWELVTGDRIYAGHPPLWYWYLRIWTWFVQEAWGIQAATAAAATAAAIVLLRFAPFPRYLKVMLLFSYYFAYEYAVMSRNYILGWLLLCLFCAFYHPVRIRYFAMAIVLALMSLTSIFGFIMAMSLLGFFVLDQFRMTNARTGSQPAECTFVTSPRLFVAVAMVAAVMMFCVLTIEPPDPNPFSPAFNLAALTPSAWPEMMFRVTAGFLPWRKFTMLDFWGGAFTYWEPASTWPKYVGSGLLVVATLAMYPSWRIMLAYVGAAAIMIAFQQARFDGAPRHWGHFFILFLAGSWIVRLQYPKRSHWFSTALIFCLLVLQAKSLVTGAYFDTTDVFSGGRDTADFIRKNGLQDLPFVSGPDYTAATVAGYLRRPFYAAETGEYDENVVFHNRRRPFSPHELMNLAVTVLRDKNSPVLLVCNQWLPEPPPGIKRTLLFTSRPGMVADEIYSVYRLQAE